MLASSGNIGAARLCPHLGLIGDPSTACLFVSDSHRCFRLETSEPVTEGEQAEYCISANYSGCPRFQGRDTGVGDLPRRRGSTGHGLLERKSTLLAAGMFLGLAIVGLVIVWGVLSGTNQAAGQSDTGSTGSTSAPVRQGSGVLPATAGGGTPTAAPTLPSQSTVSPVVVPTSPTGTPTAARTPATPGAQKIYVVSPGETLWSVALKHGISVEELMAANGLTNRSYVQAGQRLVIPGR